MQIHSVAYVFALCLISTCGYCLRYRSLDSFASHVALRSGVNLRCRCFKPFASQCSQWNFVLSQWSRIWTNLGSEFCVQYARRNFNQPSSNDPHISKTTTSISIDTLDSRILEQSFLPVDCGYRKGCQPVGDAQMHVQDTLRLCKINLLPSAKQANSSRNFLLMETCWRLSLAV